MSESLPRPNQVTPVSAKYARPDIKPAVEMAFQKPAFIERIEPYLVNGGVEGHKLYDMRCMLEIAIDFEPSISTAKINTKEKVDQMMVVVRRHYVIDKRGRFVSVNPKRYMLLAKEPEKAASEQPTQGAF